jgi:hypothetical protein
MMRIQSFSVPALLRALLLLIVGAGCAPSAEITGKEYVPEAFQANPRPVA